jgi:hypothetical protein
LATFEEHISQAKKNLSFLSKINQDCNEYWDWQVTTCFYVAVHIANAHISKKSNMHYRTHVDVKNALNPEIQLSLSKFSEENYLAYVKLLNLSRRARYLCHENPTNKDLTNGFFTYDVHMNKALKNLNKLLVYMEREYGVKFDKSHIRCISLTEETEFFIPNN